ncbi:MAG: hypothetical protein HXS47_06735 [Theionarchaea archaeon]|nr:hypothetical protein [Theionarchaea archaeon]
MAETVQIEYKKKWEAVLDTLNELSRSINVFSQSYFNNDIIAQKIYVEAIRYGITQAKIEIPQAKTPMEACQTYIDILEAVGLMASKQFELKKHNAAISCKVFPPCIYAEACRHTHEEGISPTCIRGLVFHVFIKDSTGKDFAVKVVEFNPDEGCMIQIRPVISEE